MGSATTHGSTTCPALSIHQFSTSASHHHGPAPATNHKPSRLMTTQSPFTQTIIPLYTTPSSLHIISSPQQIFCTSSTQTPAMPPQTSPSAYSEETRYYQLPAESFQTIEKELANSLSLTLTGALGFPVSLAISSQVIQTVIDKYLDKMRICSCLAAVLSIPALHWRAFS